MQAGADPDPGEGPIPLEPFPDQAQHRHLALGPVDPADPFRRKPEVRDVVGGQDVGLPGRGRCGGIGHRVSSPCG